MKRPNVKKPAELKPTLAELHARLEQIKELIPVLETRVLAYQIEDFNGLVEFFKVLLRTEQPQPMYDDLMKRTSIAIAVAALDVTNGHVTNAAKLLGLSRFGLQKIVRRLPILDESVARILKDKQPVPRKVTQ